jgi:hypothetical protein
MNAQQNSNIGVIIHTLQVSRRQLISVLDTNLPFHEFPEIVNHELWLKYLGNS